MPDARQIMSPKTVPIRPLGHSDRYAWEKLWADYNAFYGRAGDTALPAEVVDASWARLLDPLEETHGLAAERDGELIGLAHFIFHRNMIQIAKTCYLQDLFTASHARGLGIGRSLIETVCEYCRANGITDIYWHTHAENVLARTLYDSVAHNTDFLVYRRATRVEATKERNDARSQRRDVT